MSTYRTICDTLPLGEPTSFSEILLVLEAICGRLDKAEKKINQLQTKGQDE